MLIDTHVHVYPPRIRDNWREIAESEEHFGILASGKVHKWATYEEVIEQMDKDGVDESWIFGFAFNNMDLCRECNDYVIEAIKAYPDRLKGLCVVHPFGKGVEQEVRRCSEASMVGIGELFPDGQFFDLGDPRQTWRISGLAYELDMFLLFHMAEPVGHIYPGKGTSGPRKGADFCMNHPETKVVFAHWGGGLWQYELMPEMKMYLSNAWYDTAATPWLYDPAIFDAAFASGVGDKILYGSDFPLLSFGRYDKIISGTSLKPEQREKVLYKNAKKIVP
jgi:hypothetical protein